MSRKRTRNRIPALPEAVQNLLALHSLEAWPAKYETFPRGARAWSWKVTRAGENHIAGRALWTVNGSQPLDYWIEKVKLFAEGKLVYMDFETNSQWYGTDFMSSYFDELSDLKAWPGLAKFP